MRANGLSNADREPRTSRLSPRSNGVWISYFRNYSRTEDALRCIEILAANGARWRPRDSYGWCLRRTLSKIEVCDAIRHLQRIVKTGAIDQPVFQELMQTPRMKELLKQSYPGVMKLREYAGYIGSAARKNRMGNASIRKV